jgi:hypothetical protein
LLDTVLGWHAAASLQRLAATNANGRRCPAIVPRRPN